VTEEKSGTWTVTEEHQESSPETGFSRPEEPDSARAESSPGAGASVFPAGQNSGTVTADPEQPGSNEPGDSKAPDGGDEVKTVPANPAPVLPPVGNISGLQGNTKAEDTQPSQGHFVRITAGDHAGMTGVFTLIVERDGDGFATKVLVKIRDLAYDHEYVVVGYDEIEATDYNGGR
jgi:hypothetical protein